MTVADVETCALPLSEIIVRPEFKAPSNYKDADKIAKFIAEAREKWEDSLALSPITGKVVCIGILKGNEPHYLDHEDESHILEDFWALYCDHIHRNQRICGYCIRSFDI